jgi:hypothetical protein
MNRPKKTFFSKVEYLINRFTESYKDHTQNRPGKKIEKPNKISSKVSKKKLLSAHSSKNKK